MASSPSIAATSSKVVNNSKAPASSTTQFHNGPGATGDNFGSRRGGGTGSFGAGSYSRVTPRNIQTRKPSKQSLKFRLDEDAIAETTAMRSTNSRKGQTSITHLMNFSLPPRPQTYTQYSNNSRHGRRYPSSFGAGDKARYVYGNYRFVVDPRFDYSAQSIDPDHHPDWNHILQVLASATSQAASCPICLGVPVAARMAKCGHIFCLPCLIRYLQSEDDQPKYEKRARSKACPLCWDHFTLAEVKPVRWYESHETDIPQEGQDLVLRLMKRSAGSTLALPKDGAEPFGEVNDIPWFYAAEVMDYARVMKGTGDYMTEQIDAEISALEQQEKEDELMFGDDNVEWAKKAIRTLKDARTHINEDPQLQIKQEKPRTPATPARAPIEFHAGQDVPNMYSFHHTTRSGHIIDDQQTKPREPATVEMQSGSSKTTGVCAANPPNVGRRIQLTSQGPASEYYFYQALQHYYLSSLDIRILKEAFGSYALFPSTILPRIERASTGHVIDDDLRRRNKWLAHLPRGCEVNFLECDWTDTVSTEVLEKFKDDIEKRRKRNEDKDAREERDRLRAEREEEKHFAYLRRRRIDDSPPRQFHKDDFQPLISQNADTSEVDITSSTPPWGNRGQESAFASLANMSTSPSASRTIWGTPVVPPLSPPLLATEDISTKDDGWLQGWEDALMEEHVSSQIEALSVSGEASKPTPASKKKKGKKITLMSTTVRRGA